jgi:ATPase subunit of ABC transporter with duplicated ATPase domains
MCQREDVGYQLVVWESYPDLLLLCVAVSWQVQNLTIRAKGKVLLENTSLTIAAGRRYGLAGPNGKGKSTLLKLMARRQIPVPENIDVLLVEQEVVGLDDQTALAAVVAADVELMELRCSWSPPSTRSTQRSQTFTDSQHKLHPLQAACSSFQTGTYLGLCRMFAVGLLRARCFMTLLLR